MQVESSLPPPSSSSSSVLPTNIIISSSSSEHIENDPIDMCLAEVETVFDETTKIWESMQEFLSFDESSQKSNMTQTQVIRSSLGKASRELRSLEDHYVRTNMENRPLEKLRQDLEEKDKLIATFAKRLDTWKTQIDEYKARTIKVLIDEETLN